MKRISPYLKMKVLGALEFAQGDTLVSRYKAVAGIIFRDEEGHPHQFTWRTIQTWWFNYRRHGITEPASRCDTSSPRKVTPEELLVAIEKVLPHFNGRRINVTAIYRRCIDTGLLTRDRIAPNTFRRHVKRFDLLKPESQVKSKRRQAFAKAHANDMWQCDTLVGPYLRLGGKPTKVFLICFIDDASRVITHGQFHLNDNTANLIDCFQNAIFKRGVPRAMYVDNGSNYASMELARACTRIGTVLIHTPVRDGAAKGKIERFFKTLRDNFLIRDLSAINSLAGLNTAFHDWVENHYHLNRHSILDMRPIDRFGMDLQRIQWLQPSIYNREIFFAETKRKVAADNTFRHRNTRYEPPAHLAGSAITIRFDRADPNQPPIVYQDNQRLGEATALDLIANDRHPDLHIQR